MRWTPLLAAFVFTACFDPTKSEGDDDPSTGSDSGTGDTSPTTSATTTSASASETTATTTSDDTSTSLTTSVDDTTSTGVGTDDTTTGGELPPICDHAPTALAACAAAMDGAPTYGALACDPGVTDFSVFYEDIYQIDLTAGQCLYVRVDNIGEGGATGGPAADVALQLRSSSGAVAWQDDDIDCTDPAWTGGACPQLLLTVDTTDAYELSVVQASGAGCTSGAPYAMYVAIDGAAYAPAPYLDDQLGDCTP